METFKQVREWIQPGSYLIGLDLKDQFLSVPINQSYRKYLRFKWLGKIYEWCSLPFGLKCSPRVVTKLLKPVISLLRSKWDISISIYMDDILIQADTPEKAYLHAQITVLLLLALGWELNWEKSTLIPTQKLTHLGFEICTQTMTATCPDKKVQNLVDSAKIALNDGLLTVHSAERLMGLMESVRPVTPLAALNYRAIQKQLLKEKRFYRFPENIIYLSNKSKANLNWWISKTGFISNCTAPLKELNPTVHIWSDASMVGAGAHCSRGKFWQRSWSEDELSSEPHINLLEIRSAKEALFNLAIPGDQVRLHIDSKVACAYILKQGGTKSNILSNEACSLWVGLQTRDISILTPHWISTKENCGADFLSRSKVDVWEIELDQVLFSSIICHFQIMPTLDAFASKMNRKLPRYMTWMQDEEAVGRDALLCPFDPMTYVFPPIPLIPKIVTKIKEERVTALLICPQWPASLWWSLVRDMMVAPPLPLPPARDIIKTLDGEPMRVFLDPLVALLISGRI